MSTSFQPYLRCFEPRHILIPYSQKTTPPPPVSRFPGHYYNKTVVHLVKAQRGTSKARARATVGTPPPARNVCHDLVHTDHFSHGHARAIIVAAPDHPATKHVTAIGVAGIATPATCATTRGDTPINLPETCAR